MTKIEGVNSGIAGVRFMLFAGMGVGAAFWLWEGFVVGLVVGTGVVGGEAVGNGVVVGEGDSVGKLLLESAKIL